VEELVKIMDKKEQVRRFISSRYCGAITELRWFHGKQNMICGVATRICLNDCVRLFLLRLYLDSIPISIFR
jgi:hypothetical protein